MRTPPEAFVVDADDGKVFDCVICGQVGNLLCCDNCPRAYHPRCVGGKQGIDSVNWSCWECLIEDSARDGVRVPRVSTSMGPVWVIGGYVFRPTPPPPSSHKKDGAGGGGGGGMSWEAAAEEAEEAEAAAIVKAAEQGGSSVPLVDMPLPLRSWDVCQDFNRACCIRRQGRVGLPCGLPRSGGCYRHARSLFVCPWLCPWLWGCATMGDLCSCRRRVMLSCTRWRVERM